MPLQWRSQVQLFFSIKEEFSFEQRKTKVQLLQWVTFRLTRFFFITGSKFSSPQWVNFLSFLKGKKKNKKKRNEIMRSASLQVKIKKPKYKKVPLRYFRSLPRKKTILYQQPNSIAFVAKHQTATNLRIQGYCCNLAKSQKQNQSHFVACLFSTLHLL